MLSGLYGVLVANITAFCFFYVLGCLLEWKNIRIPHIREWSSETRLVFLIAVLVVSLLGFAIGAVCG